MNWYDLTRYWFDFRFENPDKCTSTHTELFLYICDKRNRFAQKEKFWLPTEYTMDNLNIRSRKTYYHVFNDLVSWWFIKIIQKSENQNTSTIISLILKNKKWKSKLDKTICLSNIYTSDDTSDDTSKGSSRGTIDKQINKETNKRDFDLFWKLYPHARISKKQDAKKYYNESKYKEDEIITEVKYMNWCIRYWIINWSFVKWCALRIRDFVPTNPHIQEQNIKKIVYALMQKKDPEVAKQLMQDFGKDVIDKFVKQYNNEHNTPILK